MKNIFLAALVLCASGCVVLNPRGIVVRQDQESGAIALYNEDDVEPSEHIALHDAERQMAAHCSPRSYQIVGRERYDTGNVVAVYYGAGVSTARRVTVTQLNYICR